MYDENQVVQVRWNNTNKNWYESRGYVFTKRNDLFDVFVKDLSLHSDKKIDVTCDYCGDNYKTQYALVMSGRKKISKDCCPNCTGKKTSEITKRKRAEKHIGLAQKICEENNYILLTDVNDYTDIKMNISFICYKHGNQTMMLSNFLRGHKCIDCSYEERACNLKHNMEYVINCIESVNGNKLLNPEDYKDMTTRNLNILCSCGNTFTTSLTNYNSHGVNTCYSCSCKESDGEKIIRNFLECNKIDFVQEKRFEDCRDNKPLPFDFYLQNYNMCIEFDGLQHFEPRFGKHSFEQTQKHDEIKNKYCKDNNINLLRISYLDGHNIEEILTKELNL